MSNLEELILTFGLCLIVTLIIEEAGALILGIRKRFDLIVILITNILTNPVAVLINMVMGSFTSVPKPIYIALIEIVVFLIEALIYSKLLYSKRPSPVILSLILNLASFLFGSAIVALIL